MGPQRRAGSLPEKRGSRVRSAQKAVFLKAERSWVQEVAAHLVHAAPFGAEHPLPMAQPVFGDHAFNRVVRPGRNPSCNPERFWVACQRVLHTCGRSDKGALS